MIVSVTMGTNGTLIENPKERLSMPVPTIAPLVARMRNRARVFFEATLTSSKVLELGEEVDAEKFERAIR